MNRIAMICDGMFVYWSPVILTLAAIAALSIYACVYILRGGKYMALFASMPLCLILGIVLGRFMHWYCRPGSYLSFGAAMTDFTQGDYALVGIFAACILVAGLLRWLRISNNLPKMLDAMAIGGSVGIAVGRLAPLFNGTSRGMVVSEQVGFPLSYPLNNAVTGVQENRLAPFMLQCFFAAVIAVVLITYVQVCYFKKKKLKDGDLFLIFLAAYCCSQILCDSMRNDALVLRSNGFVSMVQVFSAVALAIVVVILCVRSVKIHGLKRRMIPLWISFAALFGGAGYMEYYVQRHGREAAFAYSIMGTCLAGIAGLGLLLWYLSRTPAKE